MRRHRLQDAQGDGQDGGSLQRLLHVRLRRLGAEEPSAGVVYKLGPARQAEGAAHQGSEGAARAARRRGFADERGKGEGAV